MDVFSLEDLRGEGAQVPNVLPRRPALGLVQGEEADYGLWLADNFARAGLQAPGVGEMAPVTFAPNVASLQRFPLPEGKDAAWVAREYFRWLPRFCLFLVRAFVHGPVHRLCLLFPFWVLLELTREEGASAADRQLFRVTGGFLARKGRSAWLEFRQPLGRHEVLALLYGFRPALPWWLYRSTQALAHLLVMHAFARRMRRIVSSQERGDRLN